MPGNNLKDNCEYIFTFHDIDGLHTCYVDGDEQHVAFMIDMLNNCCGLVVKRRFIVIY